MPQKNRELAQDTQNIASMADGIIIASCQGEIFNHVKENLPMWSGNGHREVRQQITFRQAFLEAPNVQIGLCSLDSSHAQNLRYALQLGQISATGFEIVFRTWGDTKIARASASWCAVGRSHPQKPSVSELKDTLKNGVKNPWHVPQNSRMIMKSAAIEKL